MVTSYIFWVVIFMLCSLCSVLTPLQAIGILLWYIILEIVDNEDETWYKYSRGSLIMVLTQVMTSHVYFLKSWLNIQLKIDAYLGTF